MNSFQIIILSFFMSITVMSVSAQNNDSIKINNFSIEKNAQGDSVSLRFHLMIAPGITKANDELLLTCRAGKNIGADIRRYSRSRLSSRRHKPLLMPVLPFPSCQSGDLLRCKYLVSNCTVAHVLLD